MTKILILNAHDQSIKKYILDSLYIECDEKFISQEEYKTHLDENRPFHIPKGYSKIIVYNPNVPEEFYTDDAKVKLHLLNNGQELGKNLSQDNEVEITTALLFQHLELSIFNMTEDEFSRFQNCKNITFDFPHKNSLNIIFNQFNKIFNLQDRINYSYIMGDATDIKVNGGVDYNFITIEGNASHNTVNGNRKLDNLIVADKASQNTLNGKGGHDRISAKDDSTKNTFNGGDGKDIITIEDRANHNIAYGDDDLDTIEVRGSASYNNVSGGPGDDLLTVKGEASHNVIIGDDGLDKIEALEMANHNILQGNDGDDKIIVYENTYSNIIKGGRGHDRLYALTSNILMGGKGNDFIMSYVPHFHAKDDQIITMKGGAGNDILLGSFLSWYFRSEEEEKKSKKWYINDDEGDDIIGPYLQFCLNDVFNITKKVGYSAYSIIKKSSLTENQSTKILNSEYFINLGPGKDTFLVSSQTAYNVKSHIEGFDIKEDQLAFDDDEMPKRFLSSLYCAYNMGMSCWNLEYEGHLYEFDLGIGKQKRIRLETDKDSSDIEIIYPKWDIGENEEKITYGRYESENLVSKLSKREDFIKKEQYTYRNEVNKDIYVSTNQTINLKADSDRNIKIHWQSMNIDTGFAPKFFFTDEDNRTKLYEDLASYENNCAYIGSDIPKNLISVVVLQEDSRGIDFTITNEEGKLFSETKEGQALNCYSAIDFFTKGHFRRSQHIDNMSGSLNMRLGLVLQGQNGQIITTPMSDKIEVRITH